MDCHQQCTQCGKGIFSSLLIEIKTHNTQASEQNADKDVEGAPNILSFMFHSIVHIKIVLYLAKADIVLKDNVHSRTIRTMRRRSKKATLVGNSKKHLMEKNDE